MCSIPAEINARFDLDADIDKTLPLAALGEFITDKDGNKDFHSF